jgi:tRNA 2-thiouridine synthesizing protein A
MDRGREATRPDNATPAQGEVLVDARGHRCPLPTLLLRRALARAAPGGMVRLVADDPMAAIDVPHFAAQSGFEVIEAIQTDGAATFLVRKP